MENYDIISIYGLRFFRDVTEAGEGGKLVQDNFQEVATRIGKCNYTATSDPASANNTTQDYTVGSIWCNQSNHKVFRCIASDSTTANWVQINSTVANVKDFGAKGNFDPWNNTNVDDADAIQAAIESLIKSQGTVNVKTASGGYIFLPRGQYRITKPLEVYGNIHLIGEDGATLIWADFTNLLNRDDRGAIELTPVIGPGVAEPPGWCDHVEIAYLMICTLYGYGITASQKYVVTGTPAASRFENGRIPTGTCYSEFHHLIMSCGNTAIHFGKERSCGEDNTIHHVRFRAPGAGCIKICGDHNYIYNCDARDGVRLRSDGWPQNFNPNSYCVEIQWGQHLDYPWGRMCVVQDSMWKFTGIPNQNLGVRAFYVSGGAHRLVNNMLEYNGPNIGAYSYTFVEADDLYVDHMDCYDHITSNNPTPGRILFQNSKNVYIEKFRYNTMDTQMGSVIDIDDDTTITVGYVDSAYGPGVLDRDNIKILRWSNVSMGSWNNGNNTMPLSGNLVPNGDLAHGLDDWLMPNGYDWPSSGNTTAEVIDHEDYGHCLHIHFGTPRAGVNNAYVQSPAITIPATFVGQPGFYGVWVYGDPTKLVNIMLDGGTSRYEGTRGNIGGLYVCPIPHLTGSMRFIICLSFLAGATDTDIYIKDLHAVAGKNYNYVPNIQGKTTYTTGNIQRYDTAPPSAGTYKNGDIIWNSNPTLSTSITGWMRKGNAWTSLGTGSGSNSGPVLNILDWGVTPWDDPSSPPSSDIVNANTSAIQDAINSLYRDNRFNPEDAIPVRGGTVFFPKGTYYINNIDLLSNINLVGEGRSASVLVSINTNPRKGAIRLIRGVNGEMETSYNVGIEHLGIISEEGSCIYGEPFLFDYVYTWNYLNDGDTNRTATDRTDDSIMPYGPDGANYLKPYKGVEKIGDCLYMGYPTQFDNFIIMPGDSLPMLWMSYKYQIVEYWTGTQWKAANPWWNFSYGNADWIAAMFDAGINPRPSDWTKATVDDGQVTLPSAYWVRMRVIRDLPAPMTFFQVFMDCGILLNSRFIDLQLHAGRDAIDLISSFCQENYFQDIFFVNSHCGAITIKGDSNVLHHLDAEGSASPFRRPLAMVRMYGGEGVIRECRMEGHGNDKEIVGYMVGGYITFDNNHEEDQHYTVNYGSSPGGHGLECMGGYVHMEQIGFMYGRQMIYMKQTNLVISQLIDTWSSERPASDLFEFGDSVSHVYIDSHQTEYPNGLKHPQVSIRRIRNWTPDDQTGWTTDIPSIPITGDILTNGDFTIENEIDSRSWSPTYNRTPQNVTMTTELQNGRGKVWKITWTENTDNGFIVRWPAVRMPGGITANCYQGIWVDTSGMDDNTKRVCLNGWAGGSRIKDGFSIYMVPSGIDGWQPYMRVSGGGSGNNGVGTAGYGAGTLYFWQPHVVAGNEYNYQNQPVDRIKFAADREITYAYSTSAPTTGSWKTGSIVFCTDPLAKGYVGWVCTSESPLQWKAFGALIS